MTVRKQAPNTQGRGGLVDMNIWEREIPMEIRDQLNNIFTAIPDAISTSNEGLLETLNDLIKACFPCLDE